MHLKSLYSKNKRDTSVSLFSLPFSVFCIRTMLYFKCCPEFNITPAFYTSTADKIIAVFAYFKPCFICFIITFIRRLYFFYILSDKHIVVFIPTLEKKAPFTFPELHYLSIMNFTTLQGGIVAMKPSCVISKALNSSVFTTFLFSNVLWSSILPVTISAFTDLTSESAI